MLHEGTQIRRAADWIVGLRKSDVPSDVLQLARAQRINILAALYAGARTAVGQGVIAAFDEIGEEGNVTTLPDGNSRSMLAAAYQHAVCANALELDDFVFAGHTGQAAVMVPLTLGQVTRASGEDALLAQIAANEVAGRLGAVMTAGPQHGHMKAYLHRAAAVTASARLLHLDEETTARALAIALSAPEYPLFPGAYSADTKALCTGDPVVGGIKAAYLAADGIDATPDIVENQIGLITSLSNYDRAPPVWDRLGKTWSIQAICYKPMAACAYACAATTAAAAMVEAEGGSWDPWRVKRVDVDTTVLTMTMEGFSKPHVPDLITPVNTNFSTRRSVALCLLEGLPKGEHFLPDRFAELRDPIQRFAEKVHLRHHWPLSIHMLRGVDAAIDFPGRPGIYGMAEAHRTLDRFRAAFGTPAAVSIKDIPGLLRLKRKDLFYLARRYGVGFRTRLPFRGGKAARAAYVSRETDLRMMSLRFGARVQLEMEDGRILSNEIRTPPGFAGDPERIAIPETKFHREVGSAASPERAERLFDALTRVPDASPLEIVLSATNPMSLARPGGKDDGYVEAN
jgi:2-methylcitrate dehydratase PrpD